METFKKNLIEKKIKLNFTYPPLFVLLWNIRSSVEFRECSCLYYFHSYCFIYSKNFPPIGTLQEQKSIMTVVSLIVPRLQSRTKTHLCT